METQLTNHELHSFQHAMTHPRCPGSPEVPGDLSVLLSDVWQASSRHALSDGSSLWQVAAAKGSALRAHVQQLVTSPKGRCRRPVGRWWVGKTLMVDMVDVIDVAQVVYIYG